MLILVVPSPCIIASTVVKRREKKPGRGYMTQATHKNKHELFLEGFQTFTNTCARKDFSLRSIVTSDIASHKTTTS